MRFFRSTLGVAIQNTLTKKDIRKTLKVNSLNETISKYRDNWFNHITHSSFVRYMLSLKCGGRRSLDRTQNR
jgi:hypothetical protein